VAWCLNRRRSPGRSIGCRSRNRRVACDFRAQGSRLRRRRIRGNAVAKSGMRLTEQGERPRLLQLPGRLIGAPAEEIILGNSASWGLQVLANGLPWRPGDEVLVLADEFPATVFPWLVTERYDVTVRQLEPGRPVLEPERLQQELSPRTRVVAVNWVRSLTGHLVDVAGLHEVCERSGVHLVLNVTQGLGALPFDVRRIPVAAISCSGFKWLCGPYATGFAWIRPRHPTHDAAGPGLLACPARRRRARPRPRGRTSSARRPGRPGLRRLRHG
jgi:selenocysteine lyase/cysteine desulfurase